MLLLVILIMVGGAMLATCIALFHLGAYLKRTATQRMLARPHRDKFLLLETAAEYGAALRALVAAKSHVSDGDKEALQSGKKMLENRKIYQEGDFLARYRESVDRGIKVTSTHRVLVCYQERFFVCRVVCEGAANNKLANPKVLWLTESPLQFSTPEKEVVRQQLSAVRYKALKLGKILAAFASIPVIFAAAWLLIWCLGQYLRELMGLPSWQFAELGSFPEVTAVLGVIAITLLCVAAWFGMKARHLDTQRRSYVY